MKFRNLFIPHSETNQKAHLISWHGLVIYILLFILLQVGFSIFGYTKPGVLGVDSNIDQKSVIDLTNEQRQKMGLSPLSENLSLDKAAQAKATNMFSENYWAHFAPSGKTPWDFIQGSGYRFSYAGENLAKNFYTSDDVVKAWMASPSHKENIMNPKYKEIGIAVVDGVLNGQKTTLVVQMFGTSAALAQAPSVNINGQNIAVPENHQVSPEVSHLVASAQTQKIAPSVVNPYAVYKTVGIAVLSLVGFLLIVDFMVLKRRGIYRFSSHHFASLSFLTAGTVSIIGMHSGAVL